ncbi:hypothetical protein BCR39DRAFT_577576 [Naematelia encephala]|uniref:Uncharacterized protein n=1 Tax=Naematelia encephala TaxID=71784 RepID=A0A1Y2AXN8_9TREE|nr:hypothetical protein BCR39DRAFT_577576 [Naematelia encephala]
MLNTSALIAAQTFFQGTVDDSCADGCRNWASLAKTMVSAANCSACIASTGNNEGPTPQTAAYTAFVTNCTIEVPSLDPTGDPVVASPDEVGASTSVLGDNGDSSVDSTPTAAEAGVAGTTVTASPGAGFVRAGSHRWVELMISGAVAVMLGAI